METTYDKIKRITGRHETECDCEKCRNMCTTQCLGTPEDIWALVEAGHVDKLRPTQWFVGQMMGVISSPIMMIQANTQDGMCVFNIEGLCSLHECGLKPTEGKLAHHTLAIDNYEPLKSVSWNVAKEWINIKNQDLVERIIDKMLGDD